MRLLASMVFTIAMVACLVLVFWSFCVCTDNITKDSTTIGLYFGTTGMGATVIDIAKDSSMQVDGMDYLSMEDFNSKLKPTLLGDDGQPSGKYKECIDYAFKISESLNHQYRFFVLFLGAVFGIGILVTIKSTIRTIRKAKTYIQLTKIEK